MTKILVLERGRTRYGSGMTLTLADSLLRLNSETRLRSASFDLGGIGSAASGIRIPAVVLMTDPRRGDPVSAAQRLPPGAAVLIRHYEDPGREDLARTLVRIARRGRLLVILAVRDRAADLALACRIGADGLHLPEGILRSSYLSTFLSWRQVKAGRFLTAAAHSRRAVSRAERAGIDAVLLSPVFPTLSHPGAATLGIWRVRSCVRGSLVPVLALGGVSSETIRRLRSSGVWGGAAIGGLGSETGKWEKSS